MFNYIKNIIASRSYVYRIIPRDLGIILFVSLLSSLMISCEKYVDFKTQGQLVPGTIENYRYLLNNTSALEVAPTISDMASDDLEIVDGSPQQLSLVDNDYYGYFARAYQWADQIFPLENQYYKDDNWTSLYNTVVYANTVITEVPNISDGTPAEREELIAEAKIHRASSYLMLVNTYAKPFAQQTAATDLGVPLVLTLTTEQTLKRETVENVYKAIINDINTALPTLPESQNYNTLPSKSGAYALLARTYLYMNRFEEAANAADQALSLRNELVDLTALDTLIAGSYPLKINNPEILLSKVPVNGVLGRSAPTALRLSSSLLALFDTNDQRYNLFTVPGSIVSPWEVYDGRYFYLDAVTDQGRNVGPSVPEMILIKAENEARKGNVAEAMNLVNQLRAKRILSTGTVELTATSAQDALLKVISERRREFMFRMLRWWDMRRLKNEPNFNQTYTRQFGGKTIMLAPNSDRYVFPISKYELNMSPGLEPNP